MLRTVRDACASLLRVCSPAARAASPPRRDRRRATLFVARGNARASDRNLQAGGFNLRALFQPADQHRRRLDRRQPVAARLAPQLAVARRLRRIENDAPALQHPRIAPPQRLGLAPAAVEQHHAFETLQDRLLAILGLALPVDDDDVGVRQQAQPRAPSRGRGSPSAADRRAVRAPWQGSPRTGRSSASRSQSAAPSSRAVPSVLSCSCGC